MNSAGGPLEEEARERRVDAILIVVAIIVFIVMFAWANWH
jgi:hypothetical protein